MACEAIAWQTFKTRGAIQNLEQTWGVICANQPTLLMIINDILVSWIPAKSAQDMLEQDEKRSSFDRCGDKNNSRRESS